MVLYDLGGYQVDLSRIIEPIFYLGVSREIFPIVQELNIEDTESKYWKATQDKKMWYSIEPAYPLTHVGLAPTETPAPAVSKSIAYSRLELKRINKSVLPIDRRVTIMQQQWVEDEDLIALGAATTADDGEAKASIVTEGTNCTNATTADITTFAGVKAMIGGYLNDAVSNGMDVRQYPLRLAVTWDVYGKLLQMGSDYTDLSALQYIEVEMTRLNADSRIIPTGFLGATYARDATGQITVTAGTTNAALCLKSPNGYFIAASAIDVYPSTPEGGINLKLAERWTPHYTCDDYIYYDASVTIA